MNEQKRERRKEEGRKRGSYACLQITMPQQLLLTMMGPRPLKQIYSSHQSLTWNQSRANSLSVYLKQRGINTIKIICLFQILQRKIRIVFQKLQLYTNLNVTQGRTETLFKLFKLEFSLYIKKNFGIDQACCLFKRKADTVLTQTLS